MADRTIGIAYSMMMNDLKKQLLQDWHDCCQGKREFDSCDFYTLFHADPLLSREEVESIFQYFSPHDRGLTEKVLKVFDVIFHHKKTRLEKDEISRLAILDIKERLLAIRKYIDDYNGEVREFFDEYGLPDSLNSLDVSFTLDPDYFSQELLNKDYPGYELYYYSSDAWGNIIDRSFPCTYELKEAFYGLVLDNWLVGYLMQPLMKCPINFDPYFKMWCSGAKYVFRRDDILILLPTLNETVQNSVSAKS